METIFKKGKVRESFEPLKVSDVIEVLNHIHCVDYILDHVMEPLSQKLIRKLHQILMTGTVDEYKEQVRPGEYRTVTSRPRDRPKSVKPRLREVLVDLITNHGVDMFYVGHQGQFDAYVHSELKKLKQE